MKLNINKRYYDKSQLAPLKPLILSLYLNEDKTLKEIAYELERRGVSVSISTISRYINRSLIIRRFNLQCELEVQDGK